MELEYRCFNTLTIITWEQNRKRYLTTVGLAGEYTTLLPTCFLKKDILVPEIIGWNPKDSTCTAEIMELEMEWLNQVVENVEHNDSLPLLWSAYNAKYVTNISIIKSISFMLPLFKEDSHSV